MLTFFVSLLPHQTQDKTFPPITQTRPTISGAIPPSPICLPGMQRTSLLLLTSINNISRLSYRVGSTGHTKFVYTGWHKSHLKFDMLHVASSDVRVLGHSVDTTWRLLLRRVSESSQNMGQGLYCCDTVGFTLSNSTFWWEEKFRKCLLYIPIFLLQ